jgi:nucleoside-diphosphate-sugar epimerase
MFVVLGTKLVRSKKREEIGAIISASERDYGPDLNSVIIRYETISRDFYETLACRSVFSSSSARDVLGWIPTTSFSDGIGRTLEWGTWANLVEQHN